jgi:pyruvate,water dikinase
MGKDGLNNQLYIVQARPETVHGKDKKQVRDLQTHRKGTLITQGIALGDKIATGKARIPIAARRKSIIRRRNSSYRFDKSRLGPDHEKAAAIITKGGRTSRRSVSGTGRRCRSRLR